MKRCAAAVAFVLVFAACGEQSVEPSDAQRIWCKDDDAAHLATATHGDPAVLTAARDLELPVPECIELREAQLLTDEGIHPDTAEAENDALGEWRNN